MRELRTKTATYKYLDSRDIEKDLAKASRKYRPRGKQFSTPLHTYTERLWSHFMRQLDSCGDDDIVVVSLFKQSDPNSKSQCAKMTRELYNRARATSHKFVFNWVDPVDWGFKS